MKGTSISLFFLPCALHALNLLAKDQCKFEDAVPIKCDIKLHDYQSLYLVTCLVPQLQGMGTENGTNGKCKYSLDSLCQTLWYSISKVCLGVCL